VASALHPNPDPQFSKGKLGIEMMTQDKKEIKLAGGKYL
jgi:hypothetical protein